MQIRRGTDADLKGSRAKGAVFRLSTRLERPSVLARDEGFVCRTGDVPPGFGWYIFVGQVGALPVIPEGAHSISLPDTFNHLGDGDIVKVDPETGHISVMFQKANRHNSFLLTEKCNHYCLMCSQPPRDVDDTGIVKDVRSAIRLLDTETPEIGFTGGEPTLLGERLVELIQDAKSYLPRTGLHILSNGRAFKDAAYAARVAGIRHHDLMFGIPIYSDLSEVHDYVVQSDGAFDETIRGILNLKRHGVLVEIRVVMHQQTYARLPDLARYIARNLTFVDQVVWMGLEMTGFTRANLDKLWIDPIEYQPQLVDAVEYLAASRIKTSIYNQQLCVTDPRIWQYARQSISEWKNEYMPECEGCSVRSRCAGFFSSAKLRYSSHIKPILVDTRQGYP